MPGEFSCKETVWPSLFFLSNENSCVVYVAYAVNMTLINYYDPLAATGDVDVTDVICEIAHEI